MGIRLSLIIANPRQFQQHFTGKTERLKVVFCGHMIYSVSCGGEQTEKNYSTRIPGESMQRRNMAP